MIDHEFGKAEQVLRTVYEYCNTYIKTNYEMEKADRKAGASEKWTYYHRGGNNLALEIMRKLEVIYPDVFVKVYGAKKDD